MVSQIQKYVQEVETYAEENKQLFMSSIGAVVNAIDAKDPYTKGHSARVSALSIAVAREYGFDENGLRIVKIASLLHDVGKIGIEDRILRKPGALTDEEFEIMKTHPSKGAEILGSIPQMREMIPGIKYHHEKWSGGGYPSGLKGSDIPILARIVGIADAFDAMTTDRPYQKAMTFEMAANRIKELTPKVYDPLVTEAFLKAFHSGIFEKLLKMAEGRKEQKVAV
jgi:putative nucleotidyltransferase with HDIG domain